MTAVPLPACAPLKQVEQVKRIKFPVLNWNNSQCVHVHTLWATLHNSRFVSPVHVTRASNTGCAQLGGAVLAHFDVCHE